MDLLTFAISGLGKGNYGNGNTPFSQENIVIISRAQVQADWDSTDANSPAFIKGKPTSLGAENTVDIVWPQDGQSFEFGEEIPIQVAVNGKYYLTDLKQLPKRSYLDLQGKPGGQNLTGTSINLGNLEGNNYNYSTPSGSTSYTIVSGSAVVNGFARCFINAASEPTVTGATKVGLTTFLENEDMEMVVESPDGINVEYYFRDR